LARFELLIGSAGFWARAAGDMAAARRRVLAQAMTFEGDAAGQSVANAILAAPAADRRVLVDDYTRHNLNDTMLVFSRDPAVAAEAEATWAMFDGLVAAGVGVRVTNPLGGNPLLFPSRNHKKLLVMDDVAWIGGINFSDHNFEWKDFMFRIEDRDVADWLAAQFDADWRGDPVYSRADFGPDLTMLGFAGGWGNVPNSGELMDLFRGAERSIEVLSAYPTMPFTDAMAQAARRGVEVTIHTPRTNNKPLVRDYLLATVPQRGIRLNMLESMTHAKAALIDGTTLLVGSSNFDFVSYKINGEYIAVVRDPVLVAEAEARMFSLARERGTPPTADERRGWPRLKARIVLNAANTALMLGWVGRRVMEWKRPR